MYVGLLNITLGQNFRVVRAFVESLKFYAHNILPPIPTEPNKAKVLGQLDTCSHFHLPTVLIVHLAQPEASSLNIDFKANVGSEGLKALSMLSTFLPHQQGMEETSRKVSISYSQHDRYKS